MAFLKSAARRAQGPTAREHAGEVRCWRPNCQPIPAARPAQQACLFRPRCCLVACAQRRFEHLRNRVSRDCPDGSPCPAGNLKIRLVALCSHHPPAARRVQCSAENRVGRRIFRTDAAGPGAQSVQPEEIERIGLTTPRNVAGHRWIERPQMCIHYLPPAAASDQIAAGPERIGDVDHCWLATAASVPRKRRP